MKKILATSIAAIVLTTFTACGTVKEEPKVEETETISTTETTDQVVVEEKFPGKDFLMPFESVTITANPGDFVLAPNKPFVDRLYKDEKETIIFYTQDLVTPSEKESTLNNFSDNDYLVPNSLIVSIPKGQTAKPGDFVLTWWQSGSGMKVALVVEGGTETEPMVNYMDIGLELDSEQLKPDSFYKLTGEKLAGTPVIVSVNGSNNRETFITEANGKVLTSGWAGRLYARDSASVKPVDLYATYNVGDKVFVDTLGTYKEAVVSKIDTKLGKLTATIDNYGTVEEEEFDLTEVSKSL